MAHWAQIDENNIVTQLVVTDNNDFNDEGYDFVTRTFGGRWLKTSYNTKRGVHQLGGTPFRKNFAGIGFIYDEEKDAFCEPKPDSLEGAPDWVFNDETCCWDIGPA